MSKSKKIINNIVSDVDKSINKFIANNREALRTIAIWGEYLATDNILSANDKEGTKIYRIYNDQEKCQNLARDVIVAAKDEQNRFTIRIHPGLTFDFDIHKEINLFKCYYVLSKLTKVFEEADLSKLLKKPVESKYKEDLKQLFVNESVDKMSHIQDNSNPGHWAWGSMYYTFTYNNEYIIDMEAYDDEAYCRTRSDQIKHMSYFKVYDINGIFLYEISNMDFVALHYSKGGGDINRKIDMDNLIKSLIITK